MARLSVYPRGPDAVPENLTRATAAFRVRALLLVGFIVLFFVLYLGLLLAAAYLLYLGIAMPVHRDSIAGGVILKILLIPAGLLLFLFLCRGFFKRGSRTERTLLVEILLEDHPRLYEFIRRLCAEIRAPMPYRVFLTYEVGASVSYESGIWNLILPGKKNLTIGLGLVNVLNLTEFKAVLAHEFAHISQKSMAVGRYAYLGMRLALGMLVGRDFLDDLVDRGRQQESGWEALAWSLWAVSEGLRWTFYGLFFGLFLLQKALSRQMEFHADRVAVSVAGSDAIVHSLKRLMFADAMMERALGELGFAAKRGRYTADVLQQQTFSADQLRKQAKDPNLGEPPPVGNDPYGLPEVFSPEDEVDHPGMWADHPPNYQREDNAKRCYIRCEFDRRSPWILFEHMKDLREAVTYRMYRAVFRVSKDVKLSDARDVVKLLGEEYAERTYDERYHGLYDSRNIAPGDLAALIREATAGPVSALQLVATHARLFDDAVRVRAERYHELGKELQLLQEVVARRESGRRPREFEFRGKYRAESKAPKLLKLVQEEIEEHQKVFAEVDRDVFLVHYRMAVALGPEVVRELKSRYAFHLGVQQIWSALEGERGPIGLVLNFLDQQSGDNMDEADFLFVRDNLAAAHQTLSGCLQKARELALPPLKNLPAEEPLHRHLLEGSLVDGLVAYDYSITSKWIGKFLNQFQEVQDNADHIHFKSLSGLLSLQESISRRFLEKYAPQPEVIE